jgi:hypothetical protein
MITQWNKWANERETLCSTRDKRYLEPNSSRLHRNSETETPILVGLGLEDLYLVLPLVLSELENRVILPSKVGTRYFFLSPLPLVRYLEIVLPLRAGLLFSKIC